MLLLLQHPSFRPDILFSQHDPHCLRRIPRPNPHQKVPPPLSIRILHALHTLWRCSSTVLCLTVRFPVTMARTQSRWNSTNSHHYRRYQNPHRIHTQTMARNRKSGRPRLQKLALSRENRGNQRGRLNSGCTCHCLFYHISSWSIWIFCF